VTLYTVALALHGLVAVLAIGLVGAIPIAARAARRSEADFGGSSALLATLLRVVQLGLGVMFFTGALIDFAAAGAFHRTGWFKLSLALFVVIAISLGRARAALRRGLASADVRRAALDRVERWGWATCASVALVTLVMLTKPLP